VSYSTQSFLPWATETATVDYRQKDPAYSNTLTTAKAARYLISLKEAASSNGVYLIGDERFTLDMADITDQPRPGDRLIHNNRNLVILDCTGSPWMQFWNVTVRDLILQYDLRDTAIIRRPSPTPNAAGIRTPNQKVLAREVPCNLQPDTSQMEKDIDTGRVITRTQYSCFIGIPIDLLAGDVIEVDGVQYEVDRQSDISKIDTLTRASCSRVA